MAKKQKYQAYVVFKGRKPGVYLNWDECKAQVNGFPGNFQHGYTTLEEAERKWQEHQDQEAYISLQRFDVGRFVYDQQQVVKRKRSHIDLTGSDEEKNAPSAKRAQYRVLGSGSQNSPTFGDLTNITTHNGLRSSSGGSGVFTPYISKLPIAYRQGTPQTLPGIPPSKTQGHLGSFYQAGYSNAEDFNSFEIRRTEEFEVEEDPKIILTVEQEAVVSLSLAGKNLFITGAGGSGKTVTLKTILTRLQERQISYQVVAPTGIAALPLNGVTTYSFFGWIPETLQMSMDSIIEKRSKTKDKIIKRVEVLIVEEISMVENQFLERMNSILQAIMGNSLPFGGKQVIFLGDFHQLPPVKPFEYCLQCGSKMMRLSTEPFDISCHECDSSFEDGQKWAFKSLVWEQLNMRHVQLQQIHRQKDRAFQDILYKIRHGIILSKEEWSVLEAKKHLPPGVCAVRLMSRRKDVDAHNTRELNCIKRASKSWVALDTYEPLFETSNKYSKPWETENPLESHRFPEELSLKIGAKVVLLTNLDPRRGLVNGSQGEVINFMYEQPAERDKETPSISYVDRIGDEQPPPGYNRQRGPIKRRLKTRASPIVRFANGVTKAIFAAEISSRYGKNPKCQYIATRAQVPLALAWALTIHKSQGMTLQYIEVLSKDIFEKGQFYVALSRGTDLAGLTVTGYAREQLPIDSDVVEFYESTEWECFAPEYEAPAKSSRPQLDNQSHHGIKLLSDDEDKK